MNWDALAGFNGKFRPDALLRQAITWWIGELAACVPANLRRRITALHGRTVLVFDNAGAHLVDETGDRDKPSEQIGTPLSQRTRPLGRNGSAAIVLRLPAERALRSVVSLPLAAERNIDQVVKFEFERLTPFKHEEVFYTARITKRDHKSRRLQVELTVVPRGTVQDALRVAHDAGFRADAVEVVGPEGPTPLACDLFLKAKKPASRRLLHVALGMIALVTVALAVAAAVIPVVQSASEARTLAARVARARREADESVRLRNAIEKETENARILVARKQRTVPVTEIMDELTRLLPDDVWLTELQIGEKELRMVGFAKSATSLLGILDRSSAFANAAFRSPVTQNSATNREQFDVSAQIVENRR